MEKHINKEKKADNNGNKFGTFGGVFTPSILTILGLVMFMLTGLVVGHAGIYWALGILLISQTIAFTTGISLSAISTNTPVRGGGAYFLISRVLGPGFGSSIGITLFFAQALSIPFYILGFTGALTDNFAELANFYLWAGLSVAVILFIICWVGAGWAMKIQFIIMLILGLSIFTFLLGAAVDFNWETFHSNTMPLKFSNKSIGEEALGIAALFAIFFPAVTGIMAGVNMSGDLKDANKSIPLGTFAAILTGTVIYGLQIFLTGGAFKREMLIEEPYLVLYNNAIFGLGFIVAAGVFCATISSALGSFLGAPRILQALGKDKLIRILNPFGKGYGVSNEPRRALILTSAIILPVLFWGGIQGKESLAIVASVITMFFLYTYGMINLAAFVESYGSNPSFRPKFRYYHWSIALFGTAACLAVSFIIDWRASITALIIISILYLIAKNKSMEQTFGDARRGFVYTRVKKNLVQLSRMPSDPKNWRPTIAVLTGNPNTRYMLLKSALGFSSKRGIVSLVEFSLGNTETPSSSRQKALNKLEDFIREYDIDAFPEYIVVDNFDKGLNTFLQAHSIGPIKPNIIMMGWPNDLKRVKPFSFHLRTILNLEKSLILFINPENRHISLTNKGTIDIWWRGRKNGALMKILAYLIKKNFNWNNVKIRIIRIVNNEKQKTSAEKDLQNLLKSSRIESEPRIIISEKPFNEIFKRESADAKLIFMGFSPPNNETAESFYKSYNRTFSGMPITYLVSSSGDADLMA